MTLVPVMAAANPRPSTAWVRLAGDPVDRKYSTDTRLPMSAMPRALPSSKDVSEIPVAAPTRSSLALVRTMSDPAVTTNANEIPIKTRGITIAG